MKRGLTIGSIIVCSIILLISIAVLARQSRPLASDKTREKCLSVMDNVGKALAMYRSDNDDFSPVVETPINASVTSLLTTYSGGKALQCPSSTQPYQFRMLKKNPSAPQWSFYGNQSQSVVATCSSHMLFRRKLVWAGGGLKFVTTVDSSNPGVTNILLRDGSARSISQQSPMKPWTYDGKMFSQYSPSKVGFPRTAPPLIRFYAFEPSPPAFE